MQNKKIQDVVYELAQPLVSEKGVELVAVEYVKEGANWYLRLYIDKENGIDLEDCQEISRLMSEVLDEKDPIPQSYFLEVSSPGVERLLQREHDFAKFRGQMVNVNTFIPFQGKKIITGELGPVSKDILTVLIDDGIEFEIPREKISQVRLAWKD